MIRAAATLLLIGLGIGAATQAVAQGERKIPIEQDLRRQDRIDAAIERRAVRTGAVPPGGLPADRSPPVQSDPSGVAGFYGPPGPIGDSVNSFGALPQGAAGADVR